MTRWEYTIVVSGNEAFKGDDSKLRFDGGLNEYGQEGWEAVCIDVKNSMVFTLMKREIEMSNIIPFKKPFKLAHRDDINPEVVAEWIVQAGLWKNDPTATDQQKDLASAVLKQWGTD